MTVEELIQELQRFNGDEEVRFCFNYGDRWNTNVAQSVDSVEIGNVVYSEYHDNMIETEGDGEQTVLLS